MNIDLHLHYREELHKVLSRTRLNGAKGAALEWEQQLYAHIKGALMLVQLVRNFMK